MSDPIERYRAGNKTIAVTIMTLEEFERILKDHGTIPANRTVRRIRPLEDGFEIEMEI